MPQTNSAHNLILISAVSIVQLVEHHHSASELILSCKVCDSDISTRTTRALYIRRRCSWLVDNEVLPPRDEDLQVVAHCMLASENQNCLLLCNLPGAILSCLNCKSLWSKRRCRPLGGLDYDIHVFAADIVHRHRPVVRFWDEVVREL